MRATEFLFEYKRDITAQRLGPKLVQSGQKEGVTDVNEILAALEEMDPTTNKQYMIWLANQYIAGKFRLEDSPRIKEVLVDFGRLKSRLPEKDIGKYDLHSLEDTIDKAMGTELGSSDALEAGTFPVVPSSEILYNGPLGQLAVPKTEKASCELGSGTKWCTAAKKGNWFTHYDSKGPLYTWRDKDGSKYQFHFPSSQFMDSGDRRISHEKLQYFRTQHPVLKKLFAMKEKEFAKDPQLAYEYAKNGIQGRFPEGEEAIAKDPQLAYEYAKNVIKGRFPEGEAAIAKDPQWACEYAYAVIKGRFPESEEAIARNPKWAYEYAKNVIKGRFPEGEAAIAKNSEWAYMYATDVIKASKAAIAKNPLFSYKYFSDIIKGRLPKSSSKKS